MNQESGVDKDDNSSNINHSFRFLLISRASRSIGLIFITLSSPLYLLYLHYSILIIGVIYVFVIISSIILSVGIGMLGDRVGFKTSLLVGEIPALFISVVLTFTINRDLILIGIILSGTAGTPGGMRGAFSPGMTAYVAKNWPQNIDRVKKIGMITAISSVGSIIGAIMLYIHAYVSILFGFVGAFRFLFGIAFALIATSFLSLMFLKEKPAIKKKEKIMKKSSGKYTARVVLTNVVNGSGLGLAMVLIAPWFELRYQITPSQVGFIFIWAYLATAIGSYTAGRFYSGNRASSLKYASGTRILQGILILAVALSPFLIASEVIYAFRSAVAGFGSPNRTAVNVSGIEATDYGASTSIQGVASRLPQALSGVSGYLMDIYIPMPLILGGAIQTIGGWVYYKVLHKL